MMKRNRIIAGIFTAITVAVCAFVGWLLFAASMEKKAAYDGRNNSFAALNRIYSAKVFPDQANINQIKDNQKEVEGWLSSVSNLLHTGDLPLEQLTPAAFKQSLQASVRSLSREPGAKKGKIVLPDFHFGFDQYLGESDSLPQPAHVPRLTSQLRIIEKICSELYAAKIQSVEKIEREIFESVAVPEPEQNTGNKKNKNKKSSASSSGSVAVPEPASEYFEKQRFTFEFIATPASFVEALNKLASTDLFVVVAETSFVKTGDQLLKLTAGSGKKDSGESVEKKDPATMTHVERMITNPDIDPPVKVTLVIDVYSFKGV